MSQIWMTYEELPEMLDCTGVRVRGAGSSRAPRSEDQPRREKRAKPSVPMVSIFIAHAASELHRKARTAKVLLARLTFWM